MYTLSKNLNTFNIIYYLRLEKKTLIGIFVYWQTKEHKWPSLAGPNKSLYRTDMVVSSPEQGHTKTVGAYLLS
jgi:hypothetical protein